MASIAPSGYPDRETLIIAGRNIKLHKFSLVLPLMEHVFFRAGLVWF